MSRGCIALSVIFMLLAGCRSHPEIPVNDEQTLVMESTLLAAGVTAQKPELKTSDIQPSASSTQRTGDASSGSAAQRDYTGTFVGNVVRQRQISWGAQSQTLSLFIRGET